MKKNRKTLSKFLITTILLLVALTATHLYASEGEPQTDAERALAALQESSSGIENYTYHARVEQTLIPIASSTTIGKTEEKVDSNIIGRIAPEKTSIELQFEGTNVPAIALERENGQTYLIQNGERTLVDDPIEATAFGGSFTSYLHGAENVVERTDSSWPNYTIYQFEINGTKIGQRIAEMMRETLPPNKQYQAGGPASMASKMTGVGEVWLDEDGILRRQILDVYIPKVNVDYNSQATYVVDYKYADEANVISGLPSVINDIIIDNVVELDTLNTPILTQEQLQQIFFVLVALAVAIVILRQPKQLRTFLPLFLVFVLLTSPMLQASVYALEIQSAPLTLREALGVNDVSTDEESADATFDGRSSPIVAVEEGCNEEQDQTTDRDDDGLTDYLEYCIGTSPNLNDTDGDGITDFIETRGMYITTTTGTLETFYSNPLEPDSNFDGRSDFEEWGNPFGSADVYDIDKDDLPNLWDTDDDGDGVSDELDLNPENVSEAQDEFRFSLTNNSEFEGHQVFEFQVQPIDIDTGEPIHLRYTQHVLDWPDYDSQGTIQDTDGSKADLELMPYLRLYTTNVPEEELLLEYNIMSVQAEEGSDWHYLFVPLQAVGPAGRIEAFAGMFVDFLKIDQASRTSYRDIQFVWVAQYHADDEDDPIIVAEYREDNFRFTGLNILRDRNADYAIFGVPEDGGDNFRLYETMFKVGDRFMRYLQINIDSLETRFVTNPNEQNTWGLNEFVTMERAETAPGYLIGLPNPLGKSVVNFVTNNNYPTDEMASVVYVVEAETSSLSLDAFNEDETFFDGIYLDQKTFKADMSKAKIGIVRSINLQSMVYDDNAWSGASSEDIATHFTTFYDTEELLESATDTYPDIVVDDVELLLIQAHESFTQGMQNMVQYDDTAFVDVFSIDDDVVNEDLSPEPEDTVFTYLLDVGGLGFPGADYSLGTFDGYKNARYEIPGADGWDHRAFANVMLTYKASLTTAVVGYLVNYGFTVRNLSKRAALANDITFEQARLKYMRQAAEDYGANQYPIEESINNLRVPDEVAKVDDIDVDLIGEFGDLGEVTPGEFADEIAQQLPDGDYLVGDEGVIGGDGRQGAIFDGDDADFDFMADDDLDVLRDLDEMDEWVDELGDTPGNNLDDTESFSRSMSNADELGGARFNGYDDLGRQVDPAFDVANNRILKLSAALDDIPDTTRLARLVGKFTKVVKYLKYIAKALAIIGSVLEVAGFLIDSVIIWLNYVAFDSPYDYEKDEALFFAISFQVLLVAVVVLSLAFPPLGIAIMFFEIAYLILDAFDLANYGEWGDNRAESWAYIISAFIDWEAVTVVRDFETEGLDIEIDGPMLAGSKLKLSDRFTGYIDPVEFSGWRLQELNNGYSWGEYATQDSDAIDGRDFSNELAQERECFLDRYNLWQDCQNDMQVDVHLLEAGRDVSFGLQLNANFWTRYETQTIGCGTKCPVDTEEVFLPSELYEDDRWGFEVITLDVLPNTVEMLYTWSEFTAGDAWDNHDSDGDGLLNGREQNQLGTDPDKWDTDGDGLSDQFEVNHWDEIGTNPWDIDSDDDGLHDGIELRLGLDIAGEDTDGDGLLDGEEFPHFNLETGEWEHAGCLVSVSGYNFFVFASPYTQDLDQDNINDGSECARSADLIGDNIGGRATGSGRSATNQNITGLTSPWVTNSGAPTVEFSASPLLDAPDGRIGVFARQGDVVTATLDIVNFSPNLIDDVVSLCLPDAGWINESVSIVGSDGYTVLPVSAENNNCYEWDFSTNPINPTFGVTALYTGTVGSSATITSSYLTVAVPFEDITVDPARSIIITQSVPLVLDNQAPTVEIATPLANTRLAGDYFVIGGNSRDMVSWVDRVEITVPSGTYTATDTSTWAYTWDLPDGGIVTAQVIAYDILGNASTPFAVEVAVDSLPPVITTDFADGATIAAGESYETNIPVSGMVTDQYAGVVLVQMAFNNQPWRTVWTDTTPQQDDTPIPWSGTLKLPAINEDAQGEHALKIRAVDDFGNVGLLEQTIFVDLLPPTSEMTDRRFTAATPKHIALNEPVVLQGVANDAGRNPIAAGPIELEGTLDVLDDATIWFEPASYADSEDDITVSWIGDFNGDRLADAAIGFPNAADGQGKIVIVTGEAGDWPNPNHNDRYSLNDIKPTYFGIDGAGIGETIAPAGDVDRDGFEDMLVGDLTNNRIFVVYGSPGPQGTTITLDGYDQGRFDEISTTTLTPHFTGVGDVNRDTYDDFVITTDSAVYLLAGGFDAPEIDETELEAIAAAKFAAANATVAGVGDVNGDFTDDIVIAAGNTIYLFSGKTGWQPTGVSEILATSALQTFTSGDASVTLVRTGDLNGDGLADFVYSNGNNPVAVYGSDSGSFVEETIGSGFASTPNGFISAAGDTNKDGNSDLLVGNADGDAYLLLGGDLTTIVATIEDVADAASAPYTRGADLAGDGSADLLLIPDTTPTSVARTLSDAQPAFITDSALPQRLSNVNLPSSNNIRSSRAGGGDVTAGSETADFLSIQDAIDSGADRVLIEPGVYSEPITLTSNIVVAGSGAGLTKLTMPVSGTVLITADGITGASLTNLAVIGNGDGIGINVTNGGALDIERVLFEAMGTAVNIDGAATNVDLKNNSFVDNVNGINAANCADLDVRNTIFAYNTGTALAYEGCATIQRHEFNLFYANGTDQTPIDPGSGEVFSNPLFLSYQTGDYRVDDISPVINAGSPGDAVPPGAGGRIDIGHIEQTGGGYVASSTYCSTCDNDGLIWGVTAFDTVQGAVDSAENDLLHLLDGDGSQFIVGVDEGTYNESVVVNWNLQLLGSDADRTTLQGVSGPAVTLTSTVGTVVGGFTLIGGGASPVGVHVTGGSNSVHVTRNLIKNNTTGVLFDARSSGDVTHNTLISNTTAVETTGKYNWAYVVNNLASANTNGLVASNGGAMYAESNLLNNSINFTNITTGSFNIIDVDPLIVGDDAKLTQGSPAVDTAVKFQSDEAPYGGGAIADIGWHELTIAPLSAFMGQADDSVATESYGVGSVEYAIVPVGDPAAHVETTLPISWTTATLNDPNEQFTYWEATYTPTATGYYRIYSRATDGLGNAEGDSRFWYDGSFYVDDTAPVVAIESLETYEMVGDSWMLMKASVTDYVGTSFDISDIYFMVDGVRYDGDWMIENWEADGTSSRTFTAIYRNTRTDTTVEFVDVQAFAVDGAGQEGSSAVSEDNRVDWYSASGGISGDKVPPTFQSAFHTDDFIPFPPIPGGPFDNGNLVTGTIEITAWALDLAGLSGPDRGRSGVKAIQISVDGGLTWDTAELETEPNADIFNNITKDYTLPVPQGLDATSIPVKIRAIDFSGNAGLAHTVFTVDTAGPKMIGSITVGNAPSVGGHLDDAAEMAEFSWPMPFDGSGSLEHYGIFSVTSPDEVPNSTVTSNNITDNIIGDGGGDPYYGLATAVDEAGNYADSVLRIGPWYISQVASPYLQWRTDAKIQTLRRSHEDGIIGIRNQEYLTATEWLDDDSRPQTTQSFYAAWDPARSYIAWSGADWTQDGSMWLYYDVLDGGTTTPVTGSVRLPFDADIAVTTVPNGFGGIQTMKYQYIGGTWTNVGSAEFGFDTATYGLEVANGLSDLAPDTFQLDNHRMMAYAVDENGEVWSAFPVANSLDGKFDTYYEWSDLSEGLDLLKLPDNAQSATVQFDVQSVPGDATLLTHSDTVTYTVEIINLSPAQADDLQIELNGSAGVTYQSEAGGTCSDSCTPADRRVVDVPSIASGATQLVTITAQLDADLSGLESVTTTVKLSGIANVDNEDAVVHTLDLTPPTVVFLTAPGKAIPSEPSGVWGRSTDGTGTGVDFTEVSLDGSTWQPVINWQSDVDAEESLWTTIITPTGAHGSEMTLYARATDLYGQTSMVISRTLIVDEVAPVITPTVPSLVGGGDYVRLTGVAYDPAPDFSLVASVEIQIDDAEWVDVTLGEMLQNVTREWVYDWTLPSEDGVAHQIRYRATDYAGNVVTTTAVTILVDTIEPAVGIDVDSVMAEVGQGEATTVISGTISDNSVETLTVNAYSSNGSDVEVLTPTISTNRATTSTWALSLDSLPTGTYALEVVATDTAGNVWNDGTDKILVEVLVPTAIEIDSLTISESSSAPIWVALGAILLITGVAISPKRRIWLRK